MLRYLLLVISFGMSPATFAQTLNGIISQMNSGKKPVSGAQVVSEGANPVISQTDGTFSLSFARKNKGDDIYLAVEKQGYEVVNHKDLHTRLREDVSDILPVYMCSKGETEIRRMKFYGIQEDYISKVYLEELAKLRREKKDTWEKLKTLDEDRKIALEYAKELADRFSTTNLDNCSQRYRNAFAVFEQGEIVKAISMLADSDNDLLMAQKEVADANNMANISAVKLKTAKTNRKQAIDCYILKADLYVIQYQFSQAKTYYNKAANADTTDAAIQFECGKFFQKQNQHQEAQRYYQRCVRSARNDNNMAGLGMALINLAIVLSDNKDKAGAKKLYEEALALNRIMVQKNEGIYLPFLASTLHNLGVLLHENNEMAPAKKMLEEALLIRRKLTEKKQDVFYHNVATTLNCLGLLAKKNNNMAEGKRYYEEALQISRQLANKNRNTYLPDVAIALDNLATFLSVNDDKAGARKAYAEALLVRRELADKNPDAYLPYVATTLNNLGVLLRDINEITEAKKQYEEALQIYKKLVEKNPDVYLSDEAVTLNNLGILLPALKDTAGAKKKFEEALHVFKKLAEKNPDAYLPYVALSLNNLGLIFRDNNETGKAKKQYEDLLLVYRKLANKSPRSYGLDVVMTAIKIVYFNVLLFKETKNKHLKTECLELMKDATQRLSMFTPEEYPVVTKYKEYISQITAYFNRF